MSDRPGDRAPLVPGWTWLFLAGPVIWYLYFWVVYLAAEAGCTANSGVLVTWVTIGLTGVTMAVIAFYTLRAARRSGSDGPGAVGGPLVRAGLLLGVFFVIATLFVGIPALVLQPC